MEQYQHLIQQVMETGELLENRTGTPAYSMPGAVMRFDLQEGFPAVTTKKLAFKSMSGELCAFLRAAASAKIFREFGCKVWDQNANENEQWLANPYREGLDDLGPVYGVQWRKWPGFKSIPVSIDGQPDSVAAMHADARAKGWKSLGQFGTGPAASIIYSKEIDQLRQCVETIINDPTNRRILFHGWNPAVLDEVALPACHLLYQFLPNHKRRELSMCLYIRSNDLGLGTPFNLAEGAALQHLVARLTGYKVRWFTYMIGDAHLYVNHTEMANTILSRTPFMPPEFIIADRIPEFADAGTNPADWLEQVLPSDFSLRGYQCHEAIDAPMAV